MASLLPNQMQRASEQLAATVAVSIAALLIFLALRRRRSPRLDRLPAAIPLGTHTSEAAADTALLFSFRSHSFARRFSKESEMGRDGCGWTCSSSRQRELAHELVLDCKCI